MTRPDRQLQRTTKTIEQRQHNDSLPRAYSSQRPTLPAQPHQMSRFESNLTSALGSMPGAVHVTVSRSSVVFDGQQTHVEAEEQRFEDGEWTQQRIEGTWSGDQSQAAINAFTRGSSLLRSSRSAQRKRTIRPLPRGK